MGKRLTDRQKKEIIAASVEGTSNRRLAKAYEVSEATIRRVLAGNVEMSQKVAQKKEENTANVLAHLENRKNDVCSLIDRLLKAMEDPEKIAETPLPKLATTMAILIDKFTAGESKTQSSPAENNLLEQIRQIAGQSTGEDERGDLPEI